ncbi:MAG TPA: single-stranded DNA-binding protein [bacterium]|nr:single-stranded DNA-binding protein [bacterium]
MPDFNKVFLMGRLTKDPELRYTAGGAPVANLRMAINRVYQSQSGEKKEEVCYVTVVVWRKQAEAAGEYLKKGDPLFVEGRLQSKSWETEDKQKRTVLEVVADRVQFLNRGGKGGGSSEPSHEGTEDEGAPQGQASGSEEDIPF